MEQIRFMLEKMENDNLFHEEMSALMKGGNVGEIIGLAKEKGFVFTEADWRAYLDWRKEIEAKYGNKVLSEEDLEQVAGGKGPPPKDVIVCHCWFYAASNARRWDSNGVDRRKCCQFSCSLGNARCGCWGTEKCVDTWHKTPNYPGDCG